MAKQCRKCPWLKSTDPREIPDGYDEAKHRALQSTIARGFNLGQPLEFMACHETPRGRERPCVGWLENQLGAGNNIALRMWASKNLREELELAGEQHETFEGTLPPREGAPRRRVR